MILFAIVLFFESYGFAAESSAACQDLFAASCLNSKKQNKFGNLNENIFAEAHATVENARNATTQKLYKTDFNTALKAKLKNAGIKLNEPIDEKVWKTFIGVTAFENRFDIDQNPKLYANVAKCYQDFANLDNDTYLKSENLNDLAEKFVRVKSFSSHFDDEIVELYSRNFSKFLTDTREKCMMLNSEPEKYLVKDNPVITKICQNYEGFYRSAVSIAAKKNQPEFTKNSKAFINANLTYFLIANEKTKQPESRDSTEISSQRLAITKSLQEQRGICKTLSVLTSGAAKKVAEEFMVMVNTSQTTVDYLIDSYYPSDPKAKPANPNGQSEQQMEVLFKEVNGEVKQLANRAFGKNRLNREIAQGFDGIQFYKLTKPPQSSYIKNKNADGNILDHKLNAELSIFADPYLSFFTTLNASYLPGSVSKNRNAEQKVRMLPVFTKLNKDNPYLFIGVLAHEAGHRVGPNMAKYYRYNLDSEYSSLLDCFKNSFALEANQIDEAVADYFSAEVLAQKISRLPINDRSKALTSAMEFYCILDIQNIKFQNLNLNDVHPDASLRISGIFAANPNIRKALGCQQDPLDFKLCGLKSLNDSETKSGQTTPHLKTEDSAR